jgi:hypothetical protein
MTTSTLSPALDPEPHDQVDINALGIWPHLHQSCGGAKPTLGGLIATSPLTMMTTWRSGDYNEAYVWPTRIYIWSARGLGVSSSMT